MHWVKHDDGTWYSLELMTPSGHWHPELEERVKAAIQRYPNMYAEWWLGPSAALSVIQDWLNEELFALEQPRTRRSDV